MIGDVHGCRSELETLLTELGYRLTRDADGRAVTDAATLERIRTLVIPPAWTAVWHCRPPILPDGTGPCWAC